jgi:hypothetical protein
VLLGYRVGKHFICFNFVETMISGKTVKILSQDYKQFSSLSNSRKGETFIVNFYMNETTPIRQIQFLQKGDKSYWKAPSASGIVVARDTTSCLQCQCFAAKFKTVLYTNLLHCCQEHKSPRNVFITITTTQLQSRVAVNLILLIKN